MEFYLAPLEGLTTYVYRNAFAECFGGVNRYYTPFISPTSNHNFKSREKRDVIPEHNVGMPVVPQILTNKADEFLYTAERLREYGYDEVNLNLGCPSGTVVPKGRGAGFLAKPEELLQFLHDIYEKCSLPISIKTRIGKDSKEEFPQILEIYNRFPVKELIIHPRIQKEMYKGKPDWDVFEMALEKSENPLCYNGDINTVEDYECFIDRFPKIDRIMIGRGLLANPGLIREIQGKPAGTCSELFTFEEKIRCGYKEVMPDTPVLFKMKEIWSFMSRSLPDSDAVWKQIKKTKKLSDYENTIRRLKNEHC
ncbi:MAG: tRNA-dihydrouridine synthase family protein [Eubacterium sp.]|nr:tRNA-dihydrouridine synthase family protein [Eubacterium sp.]